MGEGEGVGLSRAGSRAFPGTGFLSPSLSTPSTTNNNNNNNRLHQPALKNVNLDRQKAVFSFI